MNYNQNNKVSTYGTVYETVTWYIIYAENTNGRIFIIIQKRIYVGIVTCCQLSSSCRPASLADSHSRRRMRPCTEERCERASSLYQASTPVDGISRSGMFTQPTQKNKTLNEGRYCMFFPNIL